MLLFPWDSELGNNALITAQHKNPNTCETDSSAVTKHLLKKHDSK
jgi:hypothetical protein